MDVLPFLRWGAGDGNVVAVASYFAWPLAPQGVRPRVHAALTVTDDKGTYSVPGACTGPGWTAWGADTLFNPTGNAGIAW